MSINLEDAIATAEQINKRGAMQFHEERPQLEQEESDD